MDQFTGILRLFVPPSTNEGTEIVIHSVTERSELDDEAVRATVKHYPIIGRAAVFYHLLPGRYRLPNGDIVLVQTNTQVDVGLSQA